LKEGQTERKAKAVIPEENVARNRSGDATEDFSLMGEQWDGAVQIRTLFHDIVNPMRALKRKV